MCKKTFSDYKNVYFHNNLSLFHHQNAFLGKEAQPQLQKALNFRFFFLPLQFGFSSSRICGGFE